MGDNARVALEASRPMALLLLLLLLVSGCSDDPSAAPDASSSAADAGGPDAQIVPVPPEPPAAPAVAEMVTLEPCPAGWRAIPGGGASATVCWPWPAESPNPCGDAEAHFPGEDACARVGAACPSGDWPEGLPAGATVLHVREGAALGDGSPTSPLGTVSEALAVAAPGSIVAIARGTYDEALTVPAGVTLWGACAAGVTLTSSTMGPTVRVGGADVVVRDVRITGSGNGVVVAAGGSCLLRDAIVTATGIGILAAGGASMDASSVVVRDTAPLSDTTLGLGLVAMEGALVRVSRASLARNRLAAAYATDAGTALVLEDVAILDTRSEASSATFGRGIGVEDAASVTAERVFVDQSRDIAIAIVDGSVTLTDVVVRDVLGSDADGSLGRGAHFYRSIATMTRVLIERARESGVLVATESTLAGDQLVVRDTRARLSDDLEGGGVYVQAAASATLSRVSLERNVKTGMFVIGFRTEATVADLVMIENGFGGLVLQEGAVASAERVLGIDNTYVGVQAALTDAAVTLTDIVIRGTRRRADGTGGGAITLLAGARVEVRRGHFTRNALVTISAGTPPDIAPVPTSVVLEDVRVEDTQPASLPDVGLFGTARGISFDPGTTGRLARVVVTGSRDIAFGSIESDLTITDLVVSGTEANAMDIYGRGMHVQGGTVEIERALFEDNREVSVSASGEGASLTMRDVVVRGTRERACAVDACTGFGAGVGVGSYLGASVSLERFVVADNALAGVQLARGVLDETAPAGAMDLAHGLVARNPVGANVQHPGFDLERLSRNVRYSGNDRNLDSAELAVPDARIDTP